MGVIVLEPHRGLETEASCSKVWQSLGSTLAHLPVDAAVPRKVDTEGSARPALLLRTPLRAPRRASATDPATRSWQSGPEPQISEAAVRNMVYWNLQLHVEEHLCFLQLLKLVNSELGLGNN